MQEAKLSLNSCSGAKFEGKFILTINVSVVFMARYVMILRGATSLRGELDGVGPENRDFFGSCHLGPKNSRIRVSYRTIYKPGMPLYISYQ